MASLNIASKANQATSFPALIVASYVNETSKDEAVNITFDEVETLKGGDHDSVELIQGDTAPIYGPEKTVLKLTEAFPILKSKHESLIHEWIKKLKVFFATDFKSVEAPLLELDSHLTLRSYVVGYSLTPADLSIWGAIRGNKVAVAAIRKGTMLSVTRWFKFIEETNPWIATAVQSANAQAQAKKTAQSSEGASYDIALPDTEKGVVTRFPPEPSGYLHIGHAKAALLNDYFAHEMYKGTMLCRFDDTNPSKEKEEFQDAIVKDLALMGIYPDKTSHTSDYFPQLYEACVTMIKEGKAFADNTEQHIMAEDRKAKRASACRNNSVEENLKHFEEMKTGSPDGVKWCIRAKIQYDSNNGALRDPVIYRCNPETHHRTGNQWKIYPTYDFCCPIVDSWEGVTHALRTIEYRDRNPQYDWMLNALNLRKVHIWDFARMNFIRTLLSKRKLTKLVDKGLVWGWDDPRFPTIRGIRRHGMTIPALREFILKQGPSRNIVNLDWTIFWATNKKFIDPVAPRHTAITKADAVIASVKGARVAPHSEQKPKHGKNPDVGSKAVWYSPEILLEQADAQLLAQGEEFTLMNWGNAYVRSITHQVHLLTDPTVVGLELELHLQGDFKATKQKLTWLSTKGQELIPVELVEFDHLITKDVIEEGDDVDDFLNPKTEFRTEAWADCNVAEVKEDDIVQFERKGYYRCDRAMTGGEPAVFFGIPTGKGLK